MNEDARLELRDAYERSRMTLDTANEAYVGIDADGRIVDWNREATRLFGWSREEATGRQLTETIVPPQMRDAHAAGLARFLATHEGRVLGRRLELTAVDRDGREFPVEMTLSALEDARGWRFTAFLHDISERKEAEEQLERRASQQAAAAEFGRTALSAGSLDEASRTRRGSSTASSRST